MQLSDFKLAIGKKMLPKVVLPSLQMIISAWFLSSRDQMSDLLADLATLR